MNVLNAFLVNYVSEFMTLMPGDVIMTGNPEGVGLALNRRLRPGDVVRCGAQGCGEQVHKVEAFAQGGQTPREGGGGPLK